MEPNNAQIKEQPRVGLYYPTWAVLTIVTLTNIYSPQPSGVTDPPVSVVGINSGLSPRHLLHGVFLKKNSCGTSISSMM